MVQQSYVITIWNCYSDLFLVLETDSAPAGTYAPRLVATSSFHGPRLFDMAHGHSQSLVQAAGTIYRRR